VLDVGCGYGGTLQALAEHCPRLELIGIDRDRAMVAHGRGRADPRIALHEADFFAYDGDRCELILMRDVLEHIGEPERALERAAALLSPSGFLFVSFAPFGGPFGGHQHNAEGLPSRLPWLHVLPARIYRRLLRVEGNSYTARVELDRDIASVLQTRLTVRRFLRGARRAGLSLVSRASYFSRPDYRQKLGLPTLRLPTLGGMEEPLTTGVEALLTHATRA
jgi:SAM-dependent methyltransferase